MSAATSMLPVYAGTTCIGFIIDRGRLGYEAFDTAERSLGVFPDSTRPPPRCSSSSSSRCRRDGAGDPFPRTECCGHLCP
jgi:hypothetical protein